RAPPAASAAPATRAQAPLLPRGRKRRSRHAGASAAPATRAQAPLLAVPELHAALGRRVGAVDVHAREQPAVAGANPAPRLALGAEQRVVDAGEPLLAVVVRAA